MFWRLPTLSGSSPVESLLDKENFTLEELLDEEEIIQECKALNSRLINFLRDRDQVEQLLHYIIEDPLEDADSQRTFKFPFIACEIFMCEIDVILKTLVDEEELMDMLFSFLDPNRSHSALLSGYFSKVVICLMTRKTVPLMTYVQSHQEVFKRLVDLIGITSIMEILVRLVGADDHLYPNSMDVMQWLADSDLLEMIVDKLNPSWPPEVHANVAETLFAITRSAPSPLAMKLSSPSFIARIFYHALEDSHSKSALVHSLSVCISLLDPKRSTPSTLMYSFRNQHVFESPLQVNPDTIAAMLPKIADLLTVLNVSLDDNILPTTYGVLKPPLGKHRLKVVEFLAVLLKTRNEVAEKELMNSGAIQKVIDLFFGYPFNNALHHHVESIIYSCVDSKNETVIDHLFRECNLVSRIIQADNVPTVSDDRSPQTLPSTGRDAPRAGYTGHLTRIANKLVLLEKTDSSIQEHLLENLEWNDWQSTVLQERNIVENVYRWACGRPTALQDRTRDSDEDDVNDRDYDVAALANNLSQAFRYNIYDNEDADEQHNGALDQDDEPLQDVYFDDESAEVVISSLRLGDDQGSNLFTNSNWFAFKDDTAENARINSSETELEEINLNGNGNSSSDDDEVVVGEDEDEVTNNSKGSTTNAVTSSDQLNGVGGGGETSLDGSNDLPESDGSSLNPFLDQNKTQTFGGSVLSSTDNITSTSSASAPSLFEDDVEFVGVDLEDAAEKKDITTHPPPTEDGGDGVAGLKEYNDKNYWKMDQEVSVVE